MVIHEMSRQECLGVLAATKLARLACARENQPYIVPVYLVYDGPSESLYGYTTPGQKVEWMRANPLVCVEIDNVAAYDQWVSVSVNGRYEELSESATVDATYVRSIPRQSCEATSEAFSESGSCRFTDARTRAWQILSTKAMWWEPASGVWAARGNRTFAEPFVPVYYRIRIDSVTGHEATQDPRDAIASAATRPQAGNCSWLRRTFMHLFGGG